MSYLKKLSTFLLAAVMSFSVVGCSGSPSSSASSSAGSSTPSSSSGMSVEERIDSSRKSLKDVKNMQSKMVMNMSLTSQGQTVDMNTIMDVTAFTDPLKMKIDMTMDMGEQGSQEMAMYAEQDGDKYIMYMSDGVQWYSEEVPAQTFDEYDARNSMDTYLDGVSDLKEVGTEKIGDKDAIKIEGVIKGETLEATLSESGALDNVKQTFNGQVSDEVLESMFKDLGEVKVSVWIDSETNYPVKYSMDMTDVMNTLYTNVLGSIEGGQDVQISVGKMEINMEDLKYNSAEDFEIPAEAKQ